MMLTRIVKIACRGRDLGRTRVLSPLVSRSSSSGPTGSEGAAGGGGGSQSITYSGGHASEGQGGFYSSGRKSSSTEPPPPTTPRPGVVALAEDVQAVSDVMQQVEELEQAIMKEVENKKSPTPSSETKTRLKELLTSPELTERLDRLQVQGQPVWGLSCSERELVLMASEKAKRP